MELQVGGKDSAHISRRRGQRFEWNGMAVLNYHSELKSNSVTSEDKSKRKGRKPISTRCPYCGVMLLWNCTLREHAKASKDCDKE